MPKSGFKTITVKQATYERLVELSKELKAGSLSETVAILCDPSNVIVPRSVWKGLVNNFVKTVQLLKALGSDSSMIGKFLTEDSKFIDAYLKRLAEDISKLTSSDNPGSS